MRGKKYLALLFCILVYGLMWKVSVDILHATSDRIIQLGFILVIFFPAACALPLLGGFIEMIRQRDRLEHKLSDEEILSRFRNLSDDTKKRIAGPLTKILQEELG